MNDRNVGFMDSYAGVLGFSGTARFAHSLSTNNKILYVQPNNVQATDPGNTGEDPLVPLATIEAALDLCRDFHGDTIFVGGNDAWTYGGYSSWTTPIQEEITITKHGVRIIGVSPDALGVPWHPVTVGGTLITVAGLGVHIEGFNFMGEAGANAIYAEWDGLTNWGENLVVRNCFFDPEIDIAIQLEYCWNCVIENNRFQECDTYGIYIDAAGSGAAYNHILNNFFYNCGVAIAYLGGDDSEIAHNRIFNIDAQNAALATNEGINTTGGARNLVHNNIFSCLLPVPANGDWDDLNTAAATDAWIHNQCMNGIAVGNPT